VDGAIKSPDFSMYEDPSTTKPMTEGMPTVVWEVAYSQDEKKLAYVLGRYVACSLGSVRLAIGVNIEHHNTIRGQTRSLKKVTCAFWEAEYTETFATFEESGLQSLGVLERCDEFAGMDNDFVVPAATKFSFVSEFGNEYIKFVVSQRNLYTVSAFPAEYSTLISMFGCRFIPKTLVGSQKCISSKDTFIAGLWMMKIRTNQNLEFHFQHF
jgi:hypothetical protein